MHRNGNVEGRSRLRTRGVTFIAHMLWATTSPNRTRCKLENVRNADRVVGSTSIKIQTAFEIRFFHWNLRCGPEKWRERALFYFIFLKMERLAVKPILMRMGCCVFWIKNFVSVLCARGRTMKCNFLFKNTVFICTCVGNCTCWCILHCTLCYIFKFFYWHSLVLIKVEIFEYKLIRNAFWLKINSEIYHKIWIIFSFSKLNIQFPQLTLSLNQGF